MLDNCKVKIICQRLCTLDKLNTTKEKEKSDKEYIKQVLLENQAFLGDSKPLSSVSSVLSDFKLLAS